MPSNFLFYLFPQNTNCFPETAWGSSMGSTPEDFPSLAVILAWLAEMVGQLSGC